MAPAPGVPPGTGAWAPALVAILGLLASARLVAFDWLEVSDGPARAFANGLQAFRADGLGAWTLFLGERMGGSALLARLLVVALHVGSSLLAWSLARRLGLARGAALFAAALFALHPLGVEALAWLSQRGRLLGTFFLLAAAGLALGPQRRERRLAAGIALALAILAEPGFLLGLPWILLAQRCTAPADADGQRARLALTLVVPAALAALLRLSFGWNMPALASLPAALLRLAALWLVPLDLSASHAPPSGGAALAALALLAPTLVGLWLLDRLPRVGLGLLFFLLTGLGATLVGAAPPLRESAAYGASFGLALALAAGAEALVARGRRGPRALGAAGALLASLAAGRALDRQGDWRSETALQASALALRPDDARALDRLGEWHLLHGRLSLAETLTLRALELAPRDASARLHLGELALRRGLIPGQEGHLRTAERTLSACEASGPVAARVALRLGEVHQRAHDPEAALPWLERAVSLDPYDPLARARLGMAALQLARFDEARAAFARASELGPRTLEAWSGLGLVALQQGEGERARACLERALALEPDHVESRTALGRLEELAGRPEEAERCYRRAVGVNPDYVDGLYALGALLATSQRGEEGLRCFDRVVELSRGQPHVRATLASARLRMQRGEIEVPLQRLRAVLAFNPAQAEARSLLEVLEAAQREAGARRDEAPR